VPSVLPRILVPKPLARACPGHPRLKSATISAPKTWMAGPSPATGTALRGRGEGDQGRSVIARRHPGLPGYRPTLRKLRLRSRARRLRQCRTSTASIPARSAGLKMLASTTAKIPVRNIPSKVPASPIETTGAPSPCTSIHATNTRKIPINSEKCGSAKGKYWSWLKSILAGPG
jgi:hypothetical protein